MRKFKFIRLNFLLFSLLVYACGSPEITQENLSISLFVDGESISAEIPSGSTARDAFELVGIPLNILDESDPPLYTILKNEDNITLTRIIEDFVIQEEVIPYETQDLRNESLPEGERRLIQPGKNGVQEITYRKILENGIEVSNSVVKTTILEAPVPEIVMVGSQAPFAAVPIEGKLIYISAGNAWLMEENTGIRRPIVTTGDLDGFILKLSPDGEWLLYSRSSDDEDEINELWVAKVNDETGLEIDLKVSNIIHFADWIPDSGLGIVFSSVKPSSTSPGWQANNDLKFINFNDSGWVSGPRTGIDENSGGIYGWWGTNFEWSPDGEELLYTRPDGIGNVDFDDEALESVFDVVPLQTGSDWAWVPDVSWAPDGDYIYLVTHAAQEGLSSHEESPLFDLTVVPLLVGPPINLVEQVGMFSNPSVSPHVPRGFEEDSYKIAYLKALVPTQSRNSGYRLFVMDRDGSNQKPVFPPEGAQGLAPQDFVWAPLLESEYNFQVALTYQGNLWIVNTLTGQSQQLTGDGLTRAVDWK